MSGACEWNFRKTWSHEWDFREDLGSRIGRSIVAVWRSLGGAGEVAT